MLSVWKAFFVQLTFDMKDNVGKKWQNMFFWIWHLKYCSKKQTKTFDRAAPTLSNILWDFSQQQKWFYFEKKHKDHFFWRVSRMCVEEKSKFSKILQGIYCSSLIWEIRRIFSKFQDFFNFFEILKIFQHFKTYGLPSLAH